jgi:hypothetical protein
MWTDGWPDMTKLIVAFRGFANAPKIESVFGSSERPYEGVLISP